MDAKVKAIEAKKLAKQQLNAARDAKNAASTEPVDGGDAIPADTPIPDSADGSPSGSTGERPQSTQQIWTATHQSGPNHLGLW